MSYSLLIETCRGTGVCHAFFALYFYYLLPGNLFSEGDWSTAEVFTEREMGQTDDNGRTLGFRRRGIMMDGEAVLAQARRVIELHEAGAVEAQFLNEVEAYCEVFDMWQHELALRGKADASGLGDTGDNLLSGIAEANGRVMSIVGGYMQDAGGALSAILKRNRAVRAYMDVLPQRISLGRPKQG